MGFAKLSMLGLLGLFGIVVGVWAGLIPLVGPLFGFGMNGAHAWSWNVNRVYFDFLPGAVAVIAGLMLLMSVPAAAAGHGRFLAAFGGLLAVLSGAWLVLGPSAYAAMTGGAAYDTRGAGTSFWSFVLSLGYHLVPGLLLVAFGAWAWGLLPHSRVRRHLATG
jgi:drug/metabolite transporter superfamily protein YnfA